MLRIQTLELRSIVDSSVQTKYFALLVLGFLLIRQPFSPQKKDLLPRRSNRIPRNPLKVKRFPLFLHAYFNKNIAHYLISYHKRKPDTAVTLCGFSFSLNYNKKQSSFCDDISHQLDSETLTLYCTFSSALINFKIPFSRITSRPSG